MMMRSALYQTNQLDFFSASSLKQVCGQTCHPNQTHYPDSEPTSLCSFSLMLRVQRRSKNVNFTVFGLTRSGLEPTIYLTRGEHTNHYTTDAVKLFGIVRAWHSESLQAYGSLIIKDMCSLSVYDVQHESRKGELKWEGMW